MRRPNGLAAAPTIIRLVTGLALGLPTALATADLQTDVEQAIRSPPLVGAEVAVSVRDAATHRELVAIGARTPMIPASNMKLITTGAALHVLGADFSFRTKLLRDGDRLIVLGDGDPAFADPTLLELMTLGDRRGIDVETFLGIWVEAVTEAGLSAVDELIVDDRIFDRQLIHPTWPADQLNRAYCAEVAGLNFHLNVLYVHPRPGPGGRALVGPIVPRAPWLTIANRASSRKGPSDVFNAWISRRHGTNEMALHGNVHSPARKPIEITVHDPPAFFAAVLADRLERAGVRVGGHRAAASGDPPGAGELVGPVVSTPISTVVTRTNRDSENMYAEALLKRAAVAIAGGPGSWSNGKAVLRHVVFERLSEPSLTELLVVADGSGLSRDNRVAPATLTRWLDTFHADPELGPVFIESLAVAGRSGTLEKRFRSADLRGATVQAKSGFINGVSCLSGYVTAPNGARRSFSVLVNGLAPEYVRPAKRLQERIVMLIAQDLVPEELTLGSD